MLDEESSIDNLQKAAKVDENGLATFEINS
jgi:hypothetical protein